MYKIEGTLQLTSPLHVASFQKNTRLTDDRKVVFGEGGKPLTRTMVRRIVDGENTIHDTAFYPSNGFRGALRRMAAKRILKQIGKVSIETYHGLTCGAPNGTPDKGTPLVSEIRRARENVYMGLYGGSQAMHPSRYRAFDALPVTEAAITGGMIPEDFRSKAVGRKFGTDDGTNYRYAAPYEILWFLDFNRNDDITTFRDHDAPAAVADYEKATLKWIEEISENRKDVEKSKQKDKDDGFVEKVSKKSIQGMNAIEAVCAGIHLHVRFDFAEDCGNHHIGLLMLDIADMANKNQIGGWGRNGFGTFIPHLNVYNDGTNEGSLLKKNGHYQVADTFGRQTDAAEDAIRALKKEDIESFFRKA